MKLIFNLINFHSIEKQLTLNCYNCDLCCFSVGIVVFSVVAINCDLSMHDKMRLHCYTPRYSLSLS